MAPVFISMTNEFSGPVKKTLDLYIYQLSDKQADRDKWPWPPPDLWIENQKELEKSFPDIVDDPFYQDEIPSKRSFFKTQLSADAEKKFTLPAELLGSGFYRIEAVSTDSGKISGEASRDFSVYDVKANSFPGTVFDFVPVNAAYNGDTIKVISGFKGKSYFSIYHVAYRTSSKNGITTKYEYVTRADKKGLNELDYKIPADIFGELRLTHVYILDNQLYREEHHIQIGNKKSPDPEMFIEKYRTQISPGEKENFVVSIKTKNAKEAVELMTTLYDASLDELQLHKWELPRNERYYSLDIDWNWNISSIQNNNLYEDNLTTLPIRQNNKPVWWISSPDFLPSYLTYYFNQSGDAYVYGSTLFQGQAAGVQIVTSSLLDVVVTGFTAKKSITGSVTTVQMRGISSLGHYAQPLVILDGFPYTGDINTIKPETITNGMILKGADAVAIYGSRASEGVLILSTHGPIILPPIPETPLPPLVIRKNFAETAFFYPMIYAGKDGLFTISFTLPESVTEWKWKLFAHTKKAGFAYLEKSLFSQLPLMVQPTMPRFLYQGDKIVIKTRITNLDSLDQSGQLTCNVEDMITGVDLGSTLLIASGHSFTVKQKSNTVGSFTLNIPANFLHPLRVRISGVTHSFSDGEEHIIPVLSRKFLVTQTTPVKAEPGQNILVKTAVFPADAEPYGLSLYINPKPQANLFNALSYLAFDPYGCAEQTLNKMLAFSMAVQISRRDSLLQKGLSKIQVPEKTEPNYKDEPEPDEQTMPWLQLRHASRIQEQKLKQLFDTTKSKLALETDLTELMGMQNSDGGLSWFKGGRTDNFISAYVLAGLGKMHQDKLLGQDFLTVNERYSSFLSNLTSYADQELTKRIKYINPLDFLYARIYWLNVYPADSLVKPVADSVLRAGWNHADTYSLDQQATLISTSLRFADHGASFGKQAASQLESIRQLAISDTLNGTRWKAFSNGDDLNGKEEETVARIAEAFQASGQSGNIVPGIVTWLLKTRNEHTWTTTKSTAAIVGLLPVADLSGSTHILSAKTQDTTLSVTDDLFTGNTADFDDLSVRKFPSQISVTTESLTPVSGSVKYYYFSSIPPEESKNAVVQVHKSLYRYNNSSEKWEPIQDSTALHIADKIKTVLIIYTARQLYYVFINERRAATMEPKQSESGYQYEDDLGYYRSVKDAGYLIFVDKIPSGTHNISYETVISASGNFTNGPASLQCMYQPSINTYSNTSSLVVNP